MIGTRPQVSWHCTHPTGGRPFTSNKKTYLTWKALCHVLFALLFFSLFAVSHQPSCFILCSSKYIVNMVYAEAAGAQISASIKYHSLKSSTFPNANANDIARALLYRVQLDEIEAIQQDPGKGNWSIIFKSISMAERLAECGFTLLEQQVFPTPYNAHLIAATVAFALPGTTPDDILEALVDCAEVKQVLPIFLKYFSTVKSGKYRVMLKPHSEGSPEEVLSSYITLHRRRASQFYAGWIPRCPYCNSATHIARDCRHKGQKSVFTVMSSVTFVLNVLTSSNPKTIKILRAAKPALTITVKKTTTTSPLLRIPHELKIQRNYLLHRQCLIIQQDTMVLKILILLVLLPQHKMNPLNAHIHTLP